MNFEKFEQIKGRKGILIDMIAAIIIAMVILEITYWLLEIIVGSSPFILAILAFVLFFLIAISMLIEIRWGPIIVHYVLYPNKFQKEKEQIEAFKKLPELPK